MNWSRAKTVFLYGLVAAVPLALAVDQHERIVAVIAAAPFVFVSLIIVFCLVVVLLRILRTRQTDLWGKYGDIWTTSLVTVVAVAGGMYLISGIGGYTTPPWQEHIIRGALGWALAYCAVGFFGGFLFGIPRVLQDGTPPPSKSQPSARDAQPYEQRVNTNLEQISDWLTKIIVGLGLVELRAVPDHLYKASVWMGESLGLKTGDTSIASFSSAFIVYFTIIGFLGGYMITRLFIAGAFWRADRRQVVESPVADYAASDADVDRIRNYWKPGGVVDPTHQAAITQWLQKQGISEILPVFISGAAYASQRTQMLKDLIP